VFMLFILCQGDQRGNHVELAKVFHQFTSVFEGLIVLGKDAVAQRCRHLPAAFACQFSMRLRELVPAADDGEVSGSVASRHQALQRAFADRRIGAFHRPNEDLRRRIVAAGAENFKSGKQWSGHGIWYPYFGRTGCGQGKSGSAFLVESDSLGRLQEQPFH
jgi:hypothetical protein